tara:strand:+ start:307 stop:1368 length:1062 start_codon:yes stop_codon:yes gene_type:complete
MSKNKYFFKKKILPVDKFFEQVLFDKKKGYYSTKFPFGKQGDFITAPGISDIFSEIIGIWIISTWHAMGKPKKFNFVELGPGDGTLTKILIKTFKKFPEFNKTINFFLYEKSEILKKLQKKNIPKNNVKWIKSFNKIDGGPIIFFGNEFFDSIPIKQFLREGNSLFEKYYSLDKKNNILSVYKKASFKENIEIKKFKSLKYLKFIEFPKLGFDILDKMVKKINKFNGGILFIDYGYLNPSNKSTIQSILKHKKNALFENLGKADITYLVNFNLLKEFFLLKNLKVKSIVTQKFFLEKMGIIERANILSKKMSFKQQSNLFLRLKRLLDVKLMGKLFKVIFAYKFKEDNFLGFK